MKIKPGTRPYLEAAAIGLPALASVYLLAKIDALLALPDTATGAQMKSALGDAQSAKALTLVSLAAGAGLAIAAYKR